MPPLKKKPKTKPTSRDKVRAYRARMRAKGFRQIQMWVPDTRTPEFAAEAHRQSLAVANSPGEIEDMKFIESLYDSDDE